MEIEIAVIKKANRLMEEFPDQLLIENALQIATQMQIAEILYKGLHTGVRNQPPFLEAMAIAMGYKNIGTTTIPEALSDVASAILEK